MVDKRCAADLEVMRTLTEITIVLDMSHSRTVQRSGRLRARRSDVCMGLALRFVMTYTVFNMLSQAYQCGSGVHSTDSLRSSGSRKYCLLPT